MKDSKDWSPCFYFFKYCNKNHHVAKQRKSVEQIEEKEQYKVWMLEYKYTHNGNNYRNK